MSDDLRLNLGCGHFPLAGYVNIDLVAEEADIKGDFMEMTYENVDEIVMYHVLEHISWHKTPEVLRKLRGWLRNGGKLVIEVPDMEALLALGTGYPTWVQNIYGESSHPGEEHRAGFTAGLLVTLLNKAAFKVDVTTVRRFASEHPMRPGFPCLEVTAFR